MFLGPLGASCYDGSMSGVEDSSRMSAGDLRALGCVLDPRIEDDAWIPTTALVQAIKRNLRRPVGGLVAVHVETEWRETDLV